MALRLTDPKFLANPAPVLAEIRAAGPLVDTRLPIVGRMKLTTSDAAARALLKDPRFVRDPRSVTGRSLQQQFWWMPRFIAPMTQNLVVRDDPDHKRLRRLVELAFAKSTVADLRPQITSLADQLLDRAGPATNVDIEAAYTRSLPFDVISMLLGLPDGLRSRAARDLAPLSLVRGPVSMLRALFRLKGVMTSFRGFFETVEPGSGLIADLVAVQEEGDRLSEDELLAMVMTLFLAGHETTVHLMNHAILALARDRALLDHFRTHPDTRHLLIEEFLRVASPVMMTKMMTAREDLDFMGAQVKRGERLSAFLLAANHDDQAVENPEEFIPDRRPNPHLAFGFGPHVCLGMQLARAETEIALDRLFARFPETRLTGPEPGWMRRPGIRARSDLRLDLA